MEQRTLVCWLKLMVVFAAVCGIVLCAGILPLEGKKLAAAYPELAYCYLPWLIFLWMLAVPCFLALMLAWRIFGRIERDCSFCMENADALRKISFLAAADAGLLFFGNALFFLLNMNHPAVLLAGCMAVVAGIGISVASAVLSHLVRKAAKLQEQSDLTI